MKLVSMKVSKADAKKMMEGSIAGGDRPRYPLGLQLQLDTESLKKLGIDDLPDVGESYTLTAKCDVVSVSSNASEGGESKNVSLQITDLAFGDMKDDGPATKIYDKGKK